MTLAPPSVSDFPFDFINVHSHTVKRAADYYLNYRPFSVKLKVKQVNLQHFLWHHECFSYYGKSCIVKMCHGLLTFSIMVWSLQGRLHSTRFVIVTRRSSSISITLSHPGMSFTFHTLHGPKPGTPDIHRFLYGSNPPLHVHS